MGTTTKWSVSYSTAPRGPFTKVADEYAETFEEVERRIMTDYSADETPAGFYKVFREGDAMGRGFEKKEHVEEFEREPS